MELSDSVNCVRESGGKLFVVGTPIGNLGDISPRAVETLKNCDIILAEDTRRTIVLLNCFEIGKKELISFSQQKSRYKTDSVINLLKSGKKIALVSDCGMPVISDPGSELLEKCYNEKINVEVIPGPSAVTSAYAVCGFSGPFIFYGFLPRDKKLRRFLRDNIEETKNMIFFDSPFRFAKTLKEMLNILGDRKIFVAREMTKLHQEFFKGKLSDAIEYFGEEILGEITAVLKGGEVERKGQNI